MSRLLSASILLMVVASMGGTGLAADSTLVERAFGRWVERAGMAPAEEILVAQVPCVDEVCLQFFLPEVQRDRVLVQIVEMAAGFGFGADVVSADLVVDRENPEMAALTIVTRPERGGPNAEQRMQMGNNNMALLRAMAGLNKSGEFPSDLRQLARGTPFYYLGGIAIGPGSSRFLLIAPPGAPPPPHAHRIEGAPGCYCIPHSASGATRQSGYFARWQTFDLRCNWVCTAGANSLE